MKLLIKTLHLTYVVVGKILPMKYCSSLLRSHGKLCEFVRCRTQEAENYTQFEMCKNVVN